MTRTTTFRHRLAAGVAFAAVASSAASCSLQGQGPSPARTPATTARPNPVRSLTACFGAAPSGWAGAVRATFPTTQFIVSAVAPAGDRAFGQYQTPSGQLGIAVVDLGTGSLTQLVAFPADSSGLLSLAVDAPWMAWVQGTSKYVEGAWTLQLRNLDTGEQLTLATSRLDDGSQGFGQVPLLAMGRGVATWAQPTSRSAPATAEVRAYDLARRQQSVVDSGRVSSPVFAGRYLVWARIGDDGRTVFRAVDASTRQPAELPERVRSQPGIMYLAGSAGYLAWSTDYQHAAAWRLDRDQLTTYAIDGLRHRLQFLVLAGRFLIWYTGDPYAVLDLDTGGGYDVAGAVAGSEKAIVRTTQLRAPASKLDVPGTALSVLPTTGAPTIPACAT